jgi:hypothetical protein
MRLVWNKEESESIEELGAAEGRHAQIQKHAEKYRQWNVHKNWSHQHRTPDQETDRKAGDSLL